MRRYFILALLVVEISAACAGAADAGPTADLTPFVRASLAPETAGTPQPSPTTLPTPTPEPRIHTVQAGETISNIALQYGVDIAAIMAANPDVNPNAMSIGIELLIPPKPAVSSASALLPTPVSIPLDEADCYRQADGGLWCFALATNNQEFTLENVTAQILVGDLDAVDITAQVANAPLNLIPAGVSLPLAARFPAPIPEPYRTGVQLLSALPVPEGDARYLETALANQQVDIQADGLTAALSGEVLLPVADGTQVQVWLAAVAFDDQGRVVGVRRWESTAAVSNSQNLTFGFRVYSAGPRIERVELYAEAQLIS